ncbi:MAG: NRDE family protein [Desulfobacterales bacterium]
MCLISIAIEAHPEYPMIIAANRDEFYSRPTSPLAFWDDNPEILAGKDLQSRGTWLGVTRSGKIAAVTNYRDPSSMTPRGESRGQLVRAYLEKNARAEDYLAEVEKKRDRYTGFNLLAGDTRQMWWYSNKDGGIVKLSPGIHALSNHLLDTPWPKTETIKRKLHALITSSRIIEPHQLLDLMFDRTVPPDDSLPDTGVGLQWERMLSPVFVASPGYGTRSSSVVLVDNSGRLVFCERSFSLTENVPLPEQTRCFEILLT